MSTEAHGKQGVSGRTALLIVLGFALFFGLVYAGMKLNPGAELLTPEQENLVRGRPLDEGRANR